MWAAGGASSGGGSERRSGETLGACHHCLTILPRKARAFESTLGDCHLLPGRALLRHEMVLSQPPQRRAAAAWWRTQALRGRGIRRDVGAHRRRRYAAPSAPSALPRSSASSASRVAGIGQYLGPDAPPVRPFPRFLRRRRLDIVVTPAAGREHERSKCGPNENTRVHGSTFISNRSRSRSMRRMLERGKRSGTQAVPTRLAVGAGQGTRAKPCRAPAQRGTGRAAAEFTIRTGT